MKWGMIVLVVLGLAAAACAAILVSTLTAGSSGPADDSLNNVEVAMAKASLPAMTVISLENIIKETLSRDDLPEGQLSSPAQVIGRVLAVPVVEGQILTNSCFVTKGTGAQLAAALPHGMRAVTLSLSRGAVPDGLLLYPGCVVDVLVSFKLSSGDNGQALSTTLLHGIQVLAVQGQSVVTEKDTEAKETPKKTQRSSSGGIKVTVLVDPKQAEALQLMSTYGQISLAMRNPLDKKLVDTEATVLSQGRLAQLGSLLRPSDIATSKVAEDSLSRAKELAEQAQAGSTLDPNTILPIPNDKNENRPPAHWDITVIRGKETKLEALDVEEEN
jgi:Flp pilus assembly protein CpaB